MWLFLPSGGPAIRDRTVKRRPVNDRWSFGVIKAVNSTVRKNQDQSEPKSERLTEFRITKAIQDRYGTTPGCIGCEAQFAGFCRRHHDECRRSIEHAMAHDDELKHRLDARDTRKGKTLERDEKFEEADEQMPEVIGEGEDEGAAESEKEEMTGSDHSACSSPTTTFPQMLDHQMMTEVGASDKKWKVVKEETSAERLISCTSSEWLWQETRGCAMQGALRKNWTL